MSTMRKSRQEFLSPDRDALSKFFDALNRSKVLLGLLGVIVYGVARVSHDAFYSGLGTTTDDVGLSYSVILTRAALYIVIYVAAGVLAAGMAAALTIAAMKRLHSGRGGEDAGQEKSTPGTRAVPLIPLAGGLLPALVAVVRPELLTTALGLPERSLRWLLGGVGAALIAFGVAWYLYRHWADVEGLWNRLRSAPSLVAGLVVMLSIVTLAFFYVAKARGDHLALQVRRGFAPNALRFELLSVRAEPVCIKWTAGPTPAVDEGKPYMLLGLAEARWLLYDFGLDRAVHVPSGQVVVVSASPIDPGRNPQKNNEWTCDAKR